MPAPRPAAASPQRASSVRRRPPPCAAASCWMWPSLAPQQQWSCASPGCAAVRWAPAPPWVGLGPTCPGWQGGCAANARTLPQRWLPSAPTSRAQPTRPGGLPPAGGRAARLGTPPPAGGCRRSARHAGFGHRGLPGRPPRRQPHPHPHFGTTDWCVDRPAGVCAGRTAATQLRVGVARASAQWQQGAQRIGLPPLHRTHALARARLVQT